MFKLEDDVITKLGYLTTMKDFVLSQKMNAWILLEFSHLGFIGEHSYFMIHCVVTVDRCSESSSAYGKY